MFVEERRPHGFVDLGGDGVLDQVAEVGVVVLPRGIASERGSLETVRNSRTLGAV